MMGASHAAAQCDADHGLTERAPLLGASGAAGGNAKVTEANVEPGGGSWELGAAMRNNHAGTEAASAVSSPLDGRPDNGTHNVRGFMSVREMWDTSYMDEDALQAKSAKLKHFYEAQNELLEAYVQYSRKDSRFLGRKEKAFLREVSAECGTPDEDSVEAGNAARARLVNYAVLISNICNIVLFFTQAFAFLSSHSLSLMANLIDAVLDLTAGAVIFYTVWARSQERDRYAYPIGRTRLESLGVILMACLMTAATLLTLEESLQTLLGGGKDVAYQGLAWPVVVLILFALGTKSGLYLYCRNIQDDAVQSLALDHKNDVIANVSSLGAALAAQYLFWALDPVGGILISLMIIRNWYQHTKEHVDSLLGRVADPKLFSIVTFLAMNHHPLVEKVDTVRCYSMGPKCFVEVDIVLSRDLPLHLAHDIGEDLQFRIEAIEDVERAFVHLDFECEHSPTFEHKIL